MAVKRHIPGAQISYKPDPVAVELLRSLRYKVVDDSRAREEWGWDPEYTDYERIVADFIQEVKTRPQLYGIS